MKNNEEFISILITNYNKSKFLKKSLDSLKKQNYKNFEIIIFDDCSTDNSLKIIKKFKKIKLIINKKKKYISPALNQINGILKCFKKSKGKIICLMDADDSFEKDKLKLLNIFFGKNENIKSVYNFPKTFGTHFKFKNKQSNKIWPTIFPTSCLAFRREYFLKFINFVKKKSFPNLEIDARLIIFFKFYYNEYNILKKQLTSYNFDNNGITSNVMRFSRLWWLRRYQAYNYMYLINKVKKNKINKSLGYFFTKIINNILN